MIGVVRAGLSCALVLAGAACSYPSQYGDSGPSTDTVAVQGVRVTPQSIQLAANGGTGLLSVTVVPANATDKTIVWESTDSSVATVDAAGLVTAHAAGSGVFITAITEDGGFEGSVNVTVIP